MNVGKKVQDSLFVCSKPFSQTTLTFIIHKGKKRPENAQKTMMRGMGMKKISEYWDTKSIRTKTLLTQFLMIVIPFVICTVLILGQVSLESQSNNAETTYQYNRYFIDTLNTSVRQMESMANTIAGNRYVRQYVSVKTDAEREQLKQDYVDTLLRYSYNRYLPTNDISILPDTNIEDILTDKSVRTYYRSEYRIWTFSMQDDQLQARFYYQFQGDNGKTGLLCFTPMPSMFTDAADHIASVNDQKCAIFSTDGVLLYSAGSFSAEDQKVMTQAREKVSEGYQLLDSRRIFSCVRSDVLPLSFVSIQPFTSILANNGMFMIYLGLIIVLLAVSIFLSYQVFFKGISKRIIRLSDACESLPIDKIGVTEGDPEKEQEGLEYPAIPVMGQDEIGTLSVSINDMIGRISELTKLNAQEVRTSQRAAYDMLAAQIHPHFIYNTLENLRMMAEINDDTEVADQLYALGRMLRLSISDASSTGEIQMEIEHAQTYLQLQKMRLNNQLEYEIDPVDPEILHAQCPRFLLQPLVENAIKHGFQQKNRPGRIHISSGRADNTIWLKVNNDGETLTEERLRQVREALKHNHPVVNTKGGIGLINVNTRLRMFYGNESGLTIDSTPASGTTCTLTLIMKE